MARHWDWYGGKNPSGDDAWGRRGRLSSHAALRNATPQRLSTALVRVDYGSVRSVLNVRRGAKLRAPHRYTSMRERCGAACDLTAPTISFVFSNPKLVVPAEAGTQCLFGPKQRHWIPACAGMTSFGLSLGGLKRDLRLQSLRTVLAARTAGYGLIAP